MRSSAGSGLCDRSAGDIAATDATTAKALLSNHTSTVDVAAELGYKPIGHGNCAIWHVFRETNFSPLICRRTMHLPKIPRSGTACRSSPEANLHLCGTPDRGFISASWTAAIWDPDLVAVTGDIVDSNKQLSLGDAGV